MIRSHFLVALLFVVSGSVFLWNLGGPAFLDYDEAAYARLIRTTEESGSFLVPYFDDHNWFDKPPHYLWLITASSHLFPDPEFALRLPGVLLGIASIFLVVAIVHLLTQSLYAGLSGGLVLAATPGFIEAARQVRFDVPVVVCMLAALYCFLRGNRWLLGVGIAVGVGVMTKSVIGFLPLLFIAILILLTKQWHVLRDKWFWSGGVIGFLIALPWHLYMTLRFGMEFWNTYLGIHVINRYAGNLFENNATNALYGEYLVQFASPWLLLLSIVTLLGIWKWRVIASNDQKRFGGLVLGLAIMMGVFFTASTKVVHYLVPLFPLVAILIGYGGHLIKNAMSLSNQNVLTVLFVFALIGGTGIWKYAYHNEGLFAFEQELAAEERKIGEALRGENATTVEFENEIYWETVKYYGHVQEKRADESRVAPYYVVTWNESAEEIPPQGEVLFEGIHRSLVKYR